MRRLLVAAAVFLPVVSFAQAPTGPEFQITSAANSSLSPPAVASDASGSVVVVWESAGRDGSDYGVAGRRFDASGAARGAEFQVNSFTSGRQSRPSVASGAAGNFVVVWSSADQDGSGDGVFGRRFDGGGVAAGPDFPVNSSTAGNQDRPAAASDPGGNVLVAWESDDGSGTGVFGQVFDPGGNKIGAEFKVSTTNSGNQERAAVAADSAGHFIVVWQSDDGSGTGIFGQVLSTGGEKVGSEFRANKTTADAQDLPSVAADPAGNFVVVWQSAGQDGSGLGVYGQRFDASGVSVGSEFRANTTTDGDQRDPGLAAKDSGFEVVWASPGLGVFGQLYDPGGAPLGSEFKINAVGDGATPRAAAGAGGFVVVWQSGASVTGRK